MRPGRFAGAAAAAFGLALLTALAPAAPASAQNEPEAERQLDEAARLALRAAEKMLGALDLFIDDLPHYAAPEVLPNGDIILRRLNPRDESELEEQQQVPRPPERDALVPEEHPVPPSERNPDASGGERRI